MTLFDLPDPDALARTGRPFSGDPAEAALADEVDGRALARKYRLAGGPIKNAVVRAAIAAAEENTPITNSILMQAGALEYEEMGFLARRGDDTGA